MHTMLLAPSTRPSDVWPHCNQSCDLTGRVSVDGAVTAVCAGLTQSVDSHLLSAVGPRLVS